MQYMWNFHLDEKGVFRLFRKIVCLLLSFLIVFSICGCSKDKAIIKYNKNTPIKKTASQVVATNSNLELVWDAENFCIMLKNISTGKIWSNIPYEYLQEQGTSNAVNSTLNITVMNISSMKSDEARGYTEAVSKGRISSEKIENGLRITYYFDNYEISIPVEYTLRKNSLEALIKTEEIIECGEYKLTAISLNPYLTSIANDSENYIFVPTGSGALMYADERLEKARSYTGSVYGEDASRIMPEITKDPEHIYLPVFGSVQSKNDALFGIIESGAEAALISAEAGNNRTGFSTVYPDFYVRGYDEYPTHLSTWGYKDLKHVADEMSKIQIKVGYYPLSGAEADYNGMVKCYREYLKDNDLLKESKVNGGIYSVSILGGLLKNVSSFGIPRKETTVLTSFSQAKKIISDILKNVGKTPSVQLLGYGDQGLDIGKIGGGFDFIKAFGKDSERKALEEFCRDKKIDLFTEFDLVRFSKSGKGFSYLNDSAKSATLHIAESYYINNPLREYDENSSFRFLKRSQISKAADRLIDTADKKNISGLSLSTLANLVYSDYSDIKYAVNGNMEKDVIEFFSKIGNSKHSVAATGPNGYAAAVADTLYGVPLTNGDYSAFDEWIPFYEMVFSGIKPMFSGYLNTVENSEKEILRAVVSGTGLCFALLYNYDIDVSVNSTFPVYGTTYENNKEFMTKTINKYGEYLEKVNGAQLLSYEINGDLSVSTFSNGIVFYANHSEKSINSPSGEIEAFSIKISEKKGEN